MGEAVGALVDESGPLTRAQEFVNGSVRIKLYKGSATVDGRKSSFSLYNQASPLALHTVPARSPRSARSSPLRLRATGAPLRARPPRRTAD